MATIEPTRSEWHAIIAVVCVVLGYLVLYVVFEDDGVGGRPCTDVAPCADPDGNRYGAP